MPNSRPSSSQISRANPGVAGRATTPRSAASPTGRGTPARPPLVRTAERTPSAPGEDDPALGRPAVGELKPGRRAIADDGRAAALELDPHASAFSGVHEVLL